MASCLLKTPYSGGIKIDYEVSYFDVGLESIEFLLMNCFYLL